MENEEEEEETIVDKIGMGAIVIFMLIGIIWTIVTLIGLSLSAYDWKQKVDKVIDNPVTTTFPASYGIEHYAIVFNNSGIDIDAYEPVCQIGSINAYPTISPLCEGKTTIGITGYKIKDNTFAQIKLFK